jgi:hypothetical protein
MKTIRFTRSVANTPCGAERVASDSEAAYLVNAGCAAYVDAEKLAAPPKASAAEIREWAAAMGVACPPKGRVPAHVREAYMFDHYGDKR